MDDAGPAAPSPGTARPSPTAPPRALPGRRGRAEPDAGMATAEYAIATLAACGFAGLLLAILTSDTVRQMLLTIIQRALSVA